MDSSSILSNNIENKYTSKLIMTFLLVFQIFFWDFMDYYVSYLPMFLSIVIILFSLKKISVTRWQMLIYVFLLFHALINILLGNLNILSFERQFIGIIVCMTASFTVLYDIEIRKFISLYVNFSVMVSCLAIIQCIMYQVNISWPFTFALNYYERVTSIFKEPSFFASIICPVVYICFEKIINKKEIIYISFWKLIVIMVAYMLTLSTIAYLLLLIAFFLSLKNKKNILIRIFLFGFIIFIFMTYIYNIEGVSERITSFFASILEDNDTIVSEMYDNSIHGSSGIWVVNFNLAILSFKNTFGFGGGLGSHVTTSSKFFSHFNTNAEDACSLFSRILSEIGIVGISGLAYFIYRYYVSSKKCSENCLYNYNIISNFILIEFISRLLRQGNYFWGGMATFVCIYYYNCKKFELEKE